MRIQKENVTMDESREIFRAHWPEKMSEEWVPIEAAKGRILAQPQFAKSNIPVVRASMMDGICVKSSLFPDGKPLSPETWRRGFEYDFADTGDDFPDEFDTTIAIEDVTFCETGEGLTLPDDLVFRPGMNVSPAGRVVKEGQPLFYSPRKLNATDLAVLAMGNIDQIPVYRKPRVAFIPTGSELISVGQPIKRGQNIDCNSIMVKGLLEDQSAEVTLFPIVRDDREQMKKALNEALASHDLILLTAARQKVLRTKLSVCSQNKERFSFIGHSVPPVDLSLSRASQGNRSLLCPDRRTGVSTCCRGLSFRVSHIGYICRRSRNTR